MRFLAVFCTFLFFTYCTTIYDADVHERDNVLVVNALITDAEETHTIHLLNTAGFGQTIHQEPEQYAIVYVEDKDGVKYYFSETSPGTYVNSFLKAEKADSYILNIQLRDGHIYQSLPQKLNPVKPIESIYGEYTSKLLDVIDHNNNLYPEYVDGIELYTDIDFGTEFSRNIRFDSDLLFQYQMVIDPELCLMYVPNDPEYCTIYSIADPPHLYCRTKIPLVDIVNLSIPDFDGSVGNTFQHTIGFVPKEKEYYPSTFGGRINRRILLTKQYSLTTEAFDFYKRIRDQLSSENALFDPIATQVFGNMYCVTEPERIVLGLFEVAAVTSQSFVFGNEPLGPDNTSLNEIPDLWFLPEHRCFLETIPEFWIYY